MKHQGTLEELKTIVSDCGFTIDEVKNQGEKHQICTNEGAKINWWPSTSKVLVQGKQGSSEKFKSAWVGYHNDGHINPKPSALTVELDAPKDKSNESKSKRVFIVYGHDERAREQLELALSKLGVKPFVLANTGGGGGTIIEELEREIVQAGEDDLFGIILMTPDDKGYAINDETNVKYRARQNVILEMGMLIAKAGRENVAILKKGALEMPSDVNDVLYISFERHIREAVPKLSRRMNNVGFEFSADQITDASS